MRARSLCSDRAWFELGCYVATKHGRAVFILGRRVSIELVLSAVRLPYSSLSAADLDTCLLPSDNQYLVIGAAPYDGCLRTLVEGIKPFVVRLAVKKEDYELSSRNLTLCELLYPVFDTMPRDVRDQCAGLRARPRFTPGFRGCDD
ncbi:hypothetical protein YC2023_004511 [Brassica napus]